VRFPDEISWVKGFNERWIVREALRKNAAGYLDHLARTDPARLLQSCRRVKLLTDRFGHREDPKPWFYAALFSLATIPEAKQFLKDHDFTLASIPRLAGALPDHPSMNRVALTTSEKISRIRKAIEELDSEVADR